MVDEGDAPIPREELEVAAAARRELTHEHEGEVIDAFLDKVGDAIDARVDARVAEDTSDTGYDYGAIGVALGSVGMGIPLTAVAGSEAGLFGVLVTWVGIVLVNVVYSRTNR